MLGTTHYYLWRSSKNWLAVRKKCPTAASPAAPALSTSTSERRNNRELRRRWPWRGTWPTSSQCVGLVVHRTISTYVECIIESPRKKAWPCGELCVALRQQTLLVDISSRAGERGGGAGEPSSLTAFQSSLPSTGNGNVALPLPAPGPYTRWAWRSAHLPYGAPRILNHENDVPGSPVIFV